MAFGRVFNIIVFAFNSKSKLTEGSRFIETAFLQPPGFLPAPSWFQILYWKLGELLQTRMIYNWVTAV